MEPKTCVKMTLPSGCWRPRRCSTLEWKDGWCEFHHPAKVAERSRQRLEESRTLRLKREEEELAELQAAARKVLDQISLATNDRDRVAILVAVLKETIEECEA